MEDLAWRVVKNHQAALLAEAERARLAGQRPPREPLLRVRLTIELQLGRRKLETTTG
jgi:hypothetical protein